MTEYNAPVDLGEKVLKQYDSQAQAGLRARNERLLSDELRDLITDSDVMGEVEQQTYAAVKEGLLVYNALASIVGENVGVAKRLSKLTPETVGTDSELKKLQEFSNGYAAFAAATYTTTKLDEILAREEDVFEQEVPPVPLKFDEASPTVQRSILRPVYGAIDHQKRGKKIFHQPIEFTKFVRDLFENYKEAGLSVKGKHPDLVQHVEGYQFRIMDDYLVLDGFSVVGSAAILEVGKTLEFSPIKPEEIVGNREGKRGIVRYVDRMALYDPVQQMNPILALGGLAWSVLLDGPPGTGKSSLFRLAMTQLRERAELVGLPYHVATIDQSIKDEFYGKTGKQLLERLEVAHDPSKLMVFVFDDVDLLTSSRSDAQGADNDINNILMQYFDGVTTVRRGNLINLAASNDPAGLDNALRNRFHKRLLIDGPVTREDFADIGHLMLGAQIEKGLVRIEMGKGYVPFETQGESNVDEATKQVEKQFEGYKHKSLHDFGEFMWELKQQNPLITGRSMKAIVESVKDELADFEVPETWFTNSGEFLEQPYERKVEMVQELYLPVTSDRLFVAAQKYFDSEQRFANVQHDEAVERMIQEARARDEAIKKMKE